MNNKENQSMSIENILRLMEGMKASGIDYLELDEADSSLVLKRHKSQPAVTYVQGGEATVLSPTSPSTEQVNTVNPLASSAAGESVKPEVEEAPGQIVTAPVVGIFFAAASPDADPFVDVGSEVKKGEVVCIIEAMKLMNEVSSTTSGRVLEIYVANGEKVQYGDPLFRIG